MRIGDREGSQVVRARELFRRGTELRTQLDSHSVGCLPLTSGRQRRSCSGPVSIRKAGGSRSRSSRTEEFPSEHRCSSDSDAGKSSARRLSSVHQTAMDAAGLFENAGPSSSNPQHPSLFELLAQDQLKDLLQPAVRYVLTFLTQRYPRYLLRILNNHEEFYAFLSFLLERHHLKKHNASLSEHFYNLRYVPTRTIPTPRLSGLEASGTQRPPSISRRQRYGLLAILVGIPYVRARAQDYFERLGGGLDPDIVANDDNVQDALPLASTLSPWKQRYRAAFKSMYPSVNLAWELYLLGYDISYMFDKTPRWRPWFNVFGVKLERAQPDSTPGSDGKRALTSYLPPLLPPLLLLLKFSQWYYSPTSPFSVLAASKKPDASSMHSRIAPPPPLPTLKSGETQREYGVCPVCEQKWQNPTALPSGWVMCWRCAWDAIDETGVCPVTGAAVSKDDLRRVLV